MNAKIFRSKRRSQVKGVVKHAKRGINCLVQTKNTTSRPLAKATAREQFKLC